MNLDVNDRAGGQELTLQDLQQKITEESLTIQQLQIQMDVLSKTVEALTQDLKKVLHTINNSKLDSPAAHAKKIRGGRLAVSINNTVITTINNSS